ncbi:MAG: alpha/beta fold hydrolase [Candidatus Dormibacteria bacterium]
MPGRRILAATAAALLAGGAAFELDRRRLRQARDADPEWWELNSPLEGRPVEVTSADGTRIHAEVFGHDEAPTIVLIPGWLERIDLWHHQIRELSKDFRVISYDHRGHGQSGAAGRDAYTDEALSDDLHAVLDELLPAGERCLAAGHSLGGMAIVAWAGRHADEVPFRLAGVALLNTGMSDFGQRATVLGDHTGAVVHKTALRTLLGTEVIWPTWLDRIGYNLVWRAALGPNATPGQVAFAHNMFITTRAQARAGIGRLFMTLDLMPSVARLTVPAVVVGGRYDRLLPLWYSEQLAEALPDLVEYVELDSGHMSPVEVPDRVTMHIGRLARACLLAHRAALEGRVILGGAAETPDEPAESQPRPRRRRRAAAQTDDVERDAASR